MKTKLRPRTLALLFATLVYQPSPGFAQGTAFSTNTYDGNGNLTITNAVNPAELKRFFRTVEP
jgi:hypothetical protein